MGTIIYFVSWVPKGRPSRGGMEGVDSDGESTEAQKCGFGGLNRKFGGGGRLGIMAGIRRSRVTRVAQLQFESG
jgi:hypothetical protein